MLGSVASLIFVFALLGGALVLLRRLARLRGEGRHLRVVESAPLEGGNRIALVKAGNRCFLLGATSRRITLLGEVSVEELPETAGAEQGGARRLPKVLRGGPGLLESFGVGSSK